MLDLSWTEKMNALKNIIFSSPGAILALLLISFIGFFFITTNRHNAKESKKVYILLYITAGLALVIKYQSHLAKIIDYFMNHVFILIYFPNLAVYVLAIVITNIMMWKSMFKSDDKALKIINTVAFCSIHYFFILLLSVIDKNKLNIFEVTSIYGNNKALALIELTSHIFILWILLIIIYHFIKKFQLKNKDLVLEEIPQESKYNQKESGKIICVDSPTTVYQVKRKEEKKAEKKEMKNIYDSMLTVEDYKLLLQLLKEHRHKEEIKVDDLKEQHKLEEFTTLYGKAK